MGGFCYIWPKSPPLVFVGISRERRARSPGDGSQGFEPPCLRHTLPEQSAKADRSSRTFPAHGRRHGRGRCASAGRARRTGRAAVWPGGRARWARRHSGRAGWHTGRGKRGGRRCASPGGRRRGDVGLGRAARLPSGTGRHGGGRGHVRAHGALRAGGGAGRRPLGGAARRGGQNAGGTRAAATAAGGTARWLVASVAAACVGFLPATRGQRAGAARLFFGIRAAKTPGARGGGEARAHLGTGFFLYARVRGGLRRKCVLLWSGWTQFVISLLSCYSGGAE